jgi:hypothetical protein
MEVLDGLGFRLSWWERLVVGWVCRRLPMVGFVDHVEGGQLARATAPGADWLKAAA